MLYTVVPQKNGTQKWWLILRRYILTAILMEALKGCMSIFFTPDVFSMILAAKCLGLAQSLRSISMPFQLEYLPQKDQEVSKTTCDAILPWNYKSKATGLWSESRIWTHVAAVQPQVCHTGGKCLSSQRYFIIPLNFAVENELWKTAQDTAQSWNNWVTPVVVFFQTFNPKNNSYTPNDSLYILESSHPSFPSFPNMSKLSLVGGFNPFEKY